MTLRSTHTFHRILSCIILAVAWCALPLHASLRSFGSREGLVDNYVTSLARDSIGLVYLSASTGIYSFDGMRLRELSSVLPDSLKTLRLVQDDRGMVTGLHGGQFYSFDGTSFLKDETGLNTVAGHIGHQITDMAVSNGKCWFIAENDTLYSSDTAYKRIRPIGPAGTHTRVRVADGFIWLFDGMVNGVTYYRDGSRQTLPSSLSQLDGYLVKDICMDKDSGILVGTNNNGVFRLSSDIRRSASPSYEISPIFPAGTDRTLSNHVSAILCIGNSLLIGTSKAGLQVLTDPGYEIERTATGIPEDIAFIFEDNERKVWIGYDGGGLHVFNNFEQLRPVSVFNQSGIPSELVIGVSMGDGKRWFGTYGDGMFHIEDSGIRRITSDSLAYCRHIHSFPDGRILAGTFNRGLFLVDKNERISGHYLDGECITGISQLDGKVAVAVGSGVHVFDPVSSDLYRLPVSLAPNSSIRCLKTDSRGWLWVGTTKGLTVYDPYSTHTSLIGEGSAIGIVRAITEDNNGNIWISTPDRLYAIRPDKTPDDSIAATVYPVYDEGLTEGMDFNRYALTTNADGKVVAGGMGDLILVDAALWKENASEVQPFITGLIIDGQYIGKDVRIRGNRTPLSRPIIDSDEIKLDYYHGFTLEFSTLDPVTALSAVYEYRLDNGSWTVMQQPALTFPELTPGKHTLLYRIAGSENIKSIVIRVAPPFWKSTWAYILYCSLGTLLAWWAFRRVTACYKKEILSRSIKTIDAIEKRTVPSQEEMFLSKARRIVEENLTDEEFSVETFAEKMAMGRSNLYKKMSAITGNSPVEFVRAIRIRRGKEIIDSGEETISQVAFQVGLSPKVFSKYFKEEFGVTPSRYIAERKG